MHLKDNNGQTFEGVRAVCTLQGTWEMTCNVLRHVDE